MISDFFSLVVLVSALGRLPPAQGIRGRQVWAGYLVSWTRWNHVRAAAALAATALLILALVQAG